VLQILMESDIEGMTGAALYERSGERATYRQGSRDRGLGTRLGIVHLKIPSYGGSYSPASSSRGVLSRRRLSR
jgi:putative transposase